jgi:small-conductance mechanosensitive channel
MSKLNKIQRHPRQDEIIARLSAGESVRSVQTWLNKIYERNPIWKVSLPTLQTFRKEVLKIDGKVLKDIQEERGKQEDELETQYIAQAVTDSSAYQDKIKQIADSHLDVATRIIQMDAIVGDRLEHWFNLVKAGEDLPQKADYELRKYIDQQMMILTQYKKLIEGMADKRVDYNVNITVMNEQIQGMQSVIVDLIREEMGPEKALDFMDKLSNRLSSVNETKALPGKVVDVKHEAE